MSGEDRVVHLICIKNRYVSEHKTLYYLGLARLCHQAGLLTLVFTVVCQSLTRT